jgi:hypothetical protein
MYHGQIPFDEFYHLYIETLQAVDESIQSVLKWVEDNGLKENTMVVYMGDNGFLFGEHGLIDKRNAYEESMRVPMLVWAPGMVKPGSVIPQMILNIDLAPTFLELAGIEKPTQMQGQSFLPLLKGENIAWRDKVFYEYYWEQAFPQTPTTYAIRSDGGAAGTKVPCDGANRPSACEPWRGAERPEGQPVDEDRDAHLCERSGLRAVQGRGHTRSLPGHGRLVLAGYLHLDGVHQRGALQLVHLEQATTQNAHVRRGERERESERERTKRTRAVETEIDAHFGRHGGREEVRVALARNDLEHLQPRVTRTHKLLLHVGAAETLSISFSKSIFNSRSAYTERTPA